MKELKHNLVCGIIVIVLLFIAALVLHHYNRETWVVVMGVLIFLGFCYLYSSVSEYRIYCELNKRISERTGAASIEVLRGLEELWLSFASKEEIQNLCKTASKLSPKESGDYIGYFLERAKIYEQTK